MAVFKSRRHACHQRKLIHHLRGRNPLRPQTEAGDVAWPPRIADVPTDVVALWRDLADSVQHPAARARFNDLLFERRDGAGRDRAVTAGTAYLAAARSRKEVDLDVTAFLVRTCEFGRKVAARQLLDEVYAELIARADDELSSGACAVQKSSLCSHLGYHVIIRRLFGTRGSGRDGAAALDHSCGVDRLAGIV